MHVLTRIRDIKSAFQVIFTNIIEAEIIKMTNIEGHREFGDKWKNIDEVLFQACWVSYCWLESIVQCRVDQKFMGQGNWTKCISSSNVT
jgi:hypothetical protein